MHTDVKYDMVPAQVWCDDLHSGKLYVIKPRNTWKHEGLKVVWNVF